MIEDADSTQNGPVILDQELGPVLSHHFPVRNTGFIVHFNVDHIAISHSGTERILVFTVTQAPMQRRMFFRPRIVLLAHRQIGGRLIISQIDLRAFALWF